VIIFFLSVEVGKFRWQNTSSVELAAVCMLFDLSSLITISQSPFLTIFASTSKSRPTRKRITDENTTVLITKIKLNSFYGFINYDSFVKSKKTTFYETF